MAFQVDMVAASRVSRRVQLLAIQLTDLSMKRTADGDGSSLGADVNRNCMALKWDGGVVEVSCNFHFRAVDGDTQVGFIDATYLLRYGVEGSEPVAEADAKHFAFANGAYNAWPFARELFFGISSKMNLPPFILPVLIFTPPRTQTKEQKVIEATATPQLPAKAT